MIGLTNRCCILALAASLAAWPTGSAVAIQDEIDAAIVIDAVQPPPNLIELIEQRPTLGEDGVVALPALSAADYPYQLTGILMKDGIPFYPYYALRDGRTHVVHPMAVGRFLTRNASGAAASDLVSAVTRIAHELPNGGRAWYYPRHYRVARMLGPHLKYSSISQGTIIAGLTAMSEKGVIGRDLAERAFLAMRWPFEKGGVNLADRAVLEMPSFSGPPEIILNGWIDALIHIRDFGEIHRNAEALDFFKRNTAFLATILPNFDDRSSTISRYSDVSPYRAKVRLSTPQDVEALQVLYRPTIDGLPAIRVPLTAPANPDDTSPYDTQLIRQDGREAFVWLACSQMYETVLFSKSAEMTVEMRSGVAGRKATTPGLGGQTLKRDGETQGEYRVVTLSKNDGLICGYPTNFSKGGTHNYYHAYHVVGLMLLAMSEQVDGADRSALIKWALKWKSDIDHIKTTEHLQFRGLHDMLGDINANQARVTYSDFDALLADVTAAAD